MGGHGFVESSCSVVGLCCQPDGGSLLVHPRADANELSSGVPVVLRACRILSWLPLVGLRSHGAQPRGGCGGPSRGARLGEHPVRQGGRRGLRKVGGRTLFPVSVIRWTLLGGGLRRVCGLRVDLGWSSLARDCWRMYHGEWHQRLGPL